MRSTRSGTKADRLAGRLADDIAAGRYAPGSMLPTDGQLAARYEVSRPTARKALDRLIAAGALTRIPQRGVLVPPASPQTGPASTASRSAETTTCLTIAAAWACRPIYSTNQCLNGMREYGRTHGLDFRNYHSATGHGPVLEVLEHIEDHPVDGVILYPFGDENYVAALEKLLDKRFPLVSFRPIGDIPLNVVMADDGGGAYEATHHLIERHHRPVHYICEPADAEICTERLLGYRSAMADAGFGDLVEQHLWRIDIPDHEPAFWGSERGWLPGLGAARRALEQISTPASFFCVNDYAARGLYQAAAEKGYRVGEDLAVVGFDGLPMAKLMTPPLTTISVDTKEIGFEAAKLLHHVLTNPGQPSVRIHLPAELTVRDSS